MADVVTASPLSLDTILGECLAAGIDPSAIDVALDEQRRRLLAVYDRLLAAGRLRQVLLVELRCSSGCLLLHCFSTMHGRVVVKPGYKQSRKVSAKANPKAVQSRTTDGERRWQRTAWLLEEMLPDNNNFSVSCGHVHLRPLPHKRIDALASSTTPGQPIVRRGEPW